MKCILLINILGQNKLKSFTDIIEDLRVLYKCYIELLNDEDNNFKGLFMQDNRMINAFQSFPEVRKKILRCFKP